MTKADLNPEIGQEEQKVLFATMEAYSDCWGYDKLSDAEMMGKRNLSFLAHHPVSPTVACAIMTGALGLSDPKQEGYNAFAPAVLLDLPDDALVFLAREGSVCVYVKSSQPVEFATADEIDENATSPYGPIPNEGRGWTRCWWD